MASEDDIHTSTTSRDGTHLTYCYPSSHLMSSHNPHRNSSLALEATSIDFGRTWPWSFWSRRAFPANMTKTGYRNSKKLGARIQRPVLVWITWENRDRCPLVSQLYHEKEKSQATWAFPHFHLQTCGQDHL
ncbi:hypothetical protein Cob_v007740 [Colletotrichum orbiculare MAFF 240422]|uniref:Uncharacterized protein n=1 Tax=Colletotrichum orbiculare (strain 104-T / ATCC 96160 / CBS 514.97 / LARS 414 / MAFF 240422) TaxID=1213857 RepID=A0A484FR41_COLOR|nr:hypothetical protein Cob_v007740 [Colletotrichum orbiculare MAFF 240422]